MPESDIASAIVIAQGVGYVMAGLLLALAIIAVARWIARRRQSGPTPVDSHDEITEVEVIRV